jgi:protein-tyrosine phosphatase
LHANPDVRWVVAVEGVRIALLARPRGGDWLADDVLAWKRAGVQVVISTLEPAEADELGLNQEVAVCQDVGIEFVPLPIQDRGLPADGVEFSRVIDLIAAHLAAGRAVGVHCRAGIGRTSVVAACLLFRCGMDAGAVFPAIESARGRPVPDTDEQRRWVMTWATG